MGKGSMVQQLCMDKCLIMGMLQGQGWFIATTLDWYGLNDMNSEWARVWEWEQHNNRGWTGDKSWETCMDEGHTAQQSCMEVGQFILWARVKHRNNPGGQRLKKEPCIRVNLHGQGLNSKNPAWARVEWQNSSVWARVKNREPCKGIGVTSQQVYKYKG